MNAWLPTFFLSFPSFFSPTSKTLIPRWFSFSVLTKKTPPEPQKKQVVAVGPGKADDKDGKLSPVGIAEGSTVLYSRYAGTDFTGEDGSEYVVISASDVLATLS